MPKLALTIACWDYDRTRSLMDGRVQVEGIDLNWVCLRPEETFRRQIRHHEFDVSEFSLSYLTFFRSRADWEYIGIPAFPSRTFRHSCIYVNTSAGIQRPQDLIGKAVGVPSYPMTAALWMRQLLQADYGVRHDQIRWFYAYADLLGWTPPPGLSVSRIPSNQNLDAMLESGELAAQFSILGPAGFAQGSPKITRLFPNYRAVEEDYYKRTRIFPIMHTLVIRQEIQAKYPWAATSLFKALQEAKQLCYHDLHETDALKYSLPWVVDEAERTERIMGEDFWAYGVTSNRHVIETLVHSSCEQGLAVRPVPVEELFARETLELD